MKDLVTPPSGPDSGWDIERVNWMGIPSS